MIRKIITILCVALLATVQLSAQSTTTYWATFETTGSGHVSLNRWSSITPGETLRLFLLPSEDWELQSVKVVLASDETTELELSDYYDKNYTAYSFVAPEDNIIVRTTFVHVWFNVTIDQPEAGGIVQVNNSKVHEGDEMIVTVYPEIEYTTAWVNVNRDDTGSSVYTYRQNNNKYIFTMPNSDVIITVGFTPKERYTIVVRSSEYGVTDVKSSGVEGENIIVTATPNKGYEVDHIWAYKTEAIGGGTHYEPLEVTRLDDTQSSFVMPAAYTTVGTDFKKRLYPVNVVSGTDMASFRLFADVVGFEGGSLAGLYIYPNQSEYTISKLTLTDEDDNELNYTIEQNNSSGTKYYFVQFTMPFSSVDVRATLKAPHACPIEILAEGPGQVVADKETALPGDTVTLTVTLDNECVIRSITASAGYEVSGGGGGAHAPSLAESLWYEQQELELSKIDDTHYQFTLPEQLASELTPNYLDATRIKVQAELVYVGPQVIYCADNTTLYFVHDEPMPIYREVGDQYEGHTITGIWNGTDVINTGWNVPGWSTFYNKVTHVVFTEGFATVRPKSCYSWFFRFTSVNVIEGLEYLNTSEVTNMNSMFIGCINLSTLNLNTFDMGSVRNTTAMFRACTALTTIYCDSTWNIATSDDMFTGCSNLLGAVAFNGTVSAEMANPYTGYFTGRWPVKMSDVKNVQIEAPDSAYTNVTVNITLTSFFGTIESVTVTGDRTGNEVTVTAGEGGTYSFVMPPEPVTITPILATPQGDVVAALWCEDNTTLYFVATPYENLEDGTWDGKTITKAWSGDKVTNMGWGTPGWDKVKSNATRVVFDESFATVRPKSCNHWFTDYVKLATIEGLENLNTSEVTNTNSMFYSCKLLTTLDLNSFDMNKVTNSSAMFRGCSALTTIYCDSTWNINTSTGMFHSCPLLLGAAPYDALKTTSVMANPHTGYFTGKWNISIPSQFEHGTVICEKTVAYTNETVTLTVTPDSRYKLESLTITIVQEETSGAPMRLRGGNIDYTEGENGTVNFVMPPAPVSVNATFTKVVPTAIDEIDATVQPDGQRYDLQGRPVGRDYRGIVIENGTKRVVK